MAEIIETAVTWDHELGTIRVDTRRKKIAHRLKSIGMKKIQGLNGYWSFEGSDSEFGITFRKRAQNSGKPRGFGLKKAVSGEKGIQGR